MQDVVNMHRGYMQWCMMNSEVSLSPKEIYPGAYPGIEVKEGNTNWGRGSGGRLEAPSGSRAVPWWGSRGRSPRKLLDFRDFIDLKTRFDGWKPAIFFIFTSDYHMLKKFCTKVGGHKPTCAPPLPKVGGHVPPLPPLSYARVTNVRRFKKHNGDIDYKNCVMHM